MFAEPTFCIVFINRALMAAAVVVFSLKSYEKILNTECAWDSNSLSQTGTVNGVPRLIEKGMVRESISQIKNGKTVEPSGVVSETVKTSGEAWLT